MSPTLRVGSWAGRRGELLAIGALVAVPLVLYGVPALAGHVYLPGDDLTQNLPLRVLAGRQLRQGHLPTFDPYLWSGSALLGGWNAGALYPLTFLFAAVPTTLAWVANEVAVYWVGGLGLYALLRALRLRPVAAFVGAASFAFAGAFDVHLEHYGLVAGTSWLPLLVLALWRLAEPRSWSSRLRWTLVLGVTGALAVLAGEPRAITTVAVVVVVVGLWLLWRSGPARGAYLACAGVGLALALALGAPQWVPGMLAIRTSQRSADSYGLYSTGSLPKAWLALVDVPSLLGGNGSFGTASWLAGYNLPEVASYVGLVPVTAFFGLLATWRPRRRLPDWGIWALLAVLGAILAFGNFSPLGHVLVHVPLFGGERLQSRNVEITDLALAVLAAYWLDAMLERAGPSSAAGAPLGPGRHHAVVGDPLVAGSLVSLALTAGLALAALADPALLGRSLGLTAAQAAGEGAERPLFAVSLVLALVLGVVVAAARRLGPRRTAAALVGFVVADLAFFNVMFNWTVASGLGAGAPSTAPGYEAFPPGTGAVEIPGPVHLGKQGRFVIYDPDLFDFSGLLALGQPDLNVERATSSAQGYTAIVDGSYAAATGAHAANGAGTDVLDPRALDDGVFDSVTTSTLITLPVYLVVAAPGTPGPVPGAAVADEVHTGTRPETSGGVAEWVFGEGVALRSVEVPWTAASKTAASKTAASSATSPAVGTALPAVTVVGTAGRSLHPALTVRSAPGGYRITFARSVLATALLLSSPSPGTFGAPVLTTTAGARYQATGSLQGALATAHWRFSGNLGPFALFTDTQAAPSLSVRGAGAGSPPPGPDGPGRSLGRVAVISISGSPLAPSAARVTSPTGALVVRAVAAIPGWSATWQPQGGGRARVLAVRRLGVVQAVDVPPGAGVVRWTYSAPGLAEAGAFFALGLVLLVVLAAVSWSTSRRRAPGTAGADPGATS